MSGAGREAHVSHAAAAAQLACLLEASAPKPGNVSPGRHFADARYEDFLASAAALGGPFASATLRPLGATARLAVEATAAWTRSNTNLGLVLLLTPLVYAAQGCAPPVDRALLRTVLRGVLDATTVDDARDVYAAIRRAAPGGLGRVDSEDVAGEPTLPLVEVMRLAGSRDAIAREYVTGFEITFEAGAPALDRARGDGLAWDDAVVETFLTLLAGRPDTHVLRRSGPDAAARVSRRAAEALQRGGVRTAAGRRTIAQMDRALRDPDNSGNPGATADLTAAAIFVVLVSGGWHRGLG